MDKAIFLDRDGVINKSVYNPKTKEFQAPFAEKDLEFYPWALRALKKLRALGYLLFLVSNQPDYAKGKTSLKNLKLIRQKFHQQLKKNGIAFKKYYYCYHHPDGVVPRYRRDCPCRKPKPYFLIKAKEKYGLDMGSSWFIGDRDSDIFCGQSAGARTVLIKKSGLINRKGRSNPDFSADNLLQAVKIIARQGIEAGS